MDSFEEFDIESFFVTDCVCVGVWYKINGCNLVVCKGVVVCIEMSREGVLFFCIYEATVVVYAEVKSCFRFAYILFFATFASDNINDVVGFACKMFIDNKGVGCRSYWNCLTGECRGACQTPLVLTGGESTFFVFVMYFGFN